MSGREMAWRVFASEYNASTMSVTGEEERSPSYVITPLGARINRLYIVGVLTEIENVGSEMEPMWRAKVSDTSGESFYISAGQYQPEAARVMAKLKAPTFVAIIGKTRTYTPEDGDQMFVSVRPEVVKEVTEKEREQWVLECCKGLRTRLDAREEAMRMAAPSVEELMKLNFSQTLSEGVVLASEHYQEVDTDPYKNLLLSGLMFFLPEYKDERGLLGPLPSRSSQVEQRPTAPANTSVQQIADAQPKSDLQPPKTEKMPDGAKSDNTDAEAQLLQIISDLDTDVNGASWDDMLEKGKASGFSQLQVEELTNELLDKGLIYEPVLGRIKKI